MHVGKISNVLCMTNCALATPLKDNELMNMECLVICFVRLLFPISSSITRLSLKQAKIPDKWNISNIIPIFKSGDPSVTSNYRPLSLLSLVSKIMERIIHNH